MSSQTPVARNRPGGPLAHSEEGLAPYAAHSAATYGRRFAEPKPAHRTEFQRDRDRVIHAKAFRRLVYKTQVFVNHEGDHYRTRLTHSLEVAQIARTVARALGLNEDLVEAISLAHDLGHTPFGHAGQDALNACMAEHGGFEHNLQSLRVVDELEDRYAAFPGLNLTFETREGILKHCSKENARKLGALGRRFLERTQPSLEAQLANLADQIAYNNHDVDDGLRAGLIDIRQLADIDFFEQQMKAVHDRNSELAGRRLAQEVVRAMINSLVIDLVANSESRILASGVKSLEDVRRQPGPLIGFSDAHRSAQREIKSFLFRSLYRHEQVQRMTDKADRVIRHLFSELMSNFKRMPPDYCQKAETAEWEDGTAGSARVVSDYIAGMTDRFALDTYEQLGGST